MPPRSPRKLSDAELRELATWPWVEESPDGKLILDTASGSLRYMRALIEALLRKYHQRQIVIESAIARFDDGIPYFQCLARLRVGGQIETRVHSGGSTPEHARFNAELFAIRKAVFDNRDIPILGRLLSHGPLSADLVWPDDVPFNNSVFRLIVRHEPNEWTPALLLPGSEEPSKMEFEPMEVALMSPAKGKRTRYMRVLELDPQLRQLLIPMMRLGETIYLHRLIAALDRCQISHLAELDAMRHDLLGDRARKLSDTLQVHHINNFGFDNRQENLQPLSDLEHKARHEWYSKDYNDPNSPVWFRADGSAMTVVRPRPRIITDPAHYDFPGHSPWDHPSIHAGSHPLAQVQSHATAPGSTLHAAGDVKPVDRAEIRLLSVKSDRRSNMLRVLKALINCGGQGLLSDLKCTRLPRQTIRNALMNLIDGGIVAQEPGRGRGHADRYRIARSFTQEVIEDILSADI